MNQSKTRKNETAHSTERPILLVAGLFLLTAIPIGLIVVLMYGLVNGSEFSPDDFTRRDFSYYRVPWVGWTLSGIQYDDITPELGQTLTTLGFVKRPKSVPDEPKTWHLYYDAAVPNSYACDARFLTSYLDFTDWDSTSATSTPFWIKWNEQFPESAKIFWPTVADLARNEMYLIIPDVMRFAMNVTEDQPGSFQTDLNRLTRAGWITSGESKLLMGEYQQATERLLRAKLIDSSSESSAKLTEQINLCRNQLEDLSEIESRAEVAAENLKSEIAMALSKQSTAKPTKAKSKIVAESQAEDDVPEKSAAIPAEAEDTSVFPDSNESSSEPNQGLNP